MTFDEMICAFDKLSCEKQTKYLKIIGQYFVNQHRSKIITAMNEVLLRLKKGEVFDGLDDVFKEIKKLIVSDNIVDQADVD